MPMIAGVTLLLCGMMTIEVPAPSGDEDAAEVLTSVRNRIRGLSASEKGGGIIVNLMPGVWTLRKGLRFEAADSGVPGSPIVWRGATGGQTVFRMSQDIPMSALKPVTDVAVQARLDKDASKSIRWADVSELGIKPPVLDKESSLMPLLIPEVYFDGERMPFARWPNSGIKDVGRREAWTTIEKILEKGWTRDEQPPGPTGGVFRYSGNRPSRWTKAPVVYLQGFWAFDWWESIIPVSRIDTATNTIALKFPHLFGVHQGNPSPRRWRAVHLLEELDVPGEYCFDFDAKRLYFYPPRSEGRLSVAGRKDPFVTLVGVSDFALEDVVMEEGFDSAIYGKDLRRVRFEGLKCRNLFAAAGTIANAEECVIRRCDVDETGRGGFSISGGDRKTLRSGNNLIEDCRIRNYSRLQFCYANAITMNGVGGRALHNELCDAPHMAVGWGCNDGLFAYNLVSNVVNCSDDAGAFYKGKNPSVRGNVIRNNLFIDIGSERGHGTAAIYFDDGDVGETVEGNVFVRAGRPGKGSFGTVFSHGGFSNVVCNCVFVDCKRPFGSAPWSDKHWRDYVLAPLWQTRLLKEVDITKEPYLSRYPDFAGFMDPQPGQARDNLATNNVIVNCESVCSGRFVTNATDVVFAGDPGFRDAAHGDYRLKPDSEVFRRLPDFRPIPLEKIGLLTPRD